MEDFSASLVREKIMLDDVQRGANLTEMDEGRTVIRSNRIFFKLTDGTHTEKIVVRTQNMHTTLRLSGRIVFNFFRGGSFLNRDLPFEWDSQWRDVLSHYEKEFNPSIWAAVYINGKSVFRTTTSAYIDVIEKCALLSQDNYDATMNVTEDVLKQLGREMHINHDSNIAAVLQDTKDSLRCSIVHRSDVRDTTFSFTAEGGERHNRIVQSFGIAAAFLEAFNLRFVLDGLHQKKNKGDIANVSKEANQLRGATARLVALHKGIRSFEEIYKVTYRPDKPRFFDV